MIQTSYANAEEAYLAQGDADDILDKAEQRILDIAGDRLRKGFGGLEGILHNTVGFLEVLQKNKGQTTGVPTGFTSLDTLTSGFQKANLVIIAGRPSMGKTALALNIARYAAVEANAPVGLFSLFLVNG